MNDTASKSEAEDKEAEDALESKVTEEVTDQTGTEDEESKSPDEGDSDEVSKWKSFSRKHEAEKKELQKEIDAVKAELEAYRKKDAEATERALAEKVSTLSEASQALVESLVKKGLSKADAIEVVSETETTDEGEKPKKLRPSGFDKKPQSKKITTAQERRQEKLNQYREAKGLPLR